MKNSASIVKEGKVPKPSLLDLPEPIVEHILEFFSAAELCVLSEVCISLRDMCRKDSLWKKLIEQKWSILIGDAVYREWKWQMIGRKRADQPNIEKPTLYPFYGVWPNIYIGSYLENNYSSSSSLSSESMMALYISLERGWFWFPAQIYRRGSYYYDALISYDSRTVSFRVRERYGGWGLIEENVKWDRIRMADSSPYVLHVSDCLEDLKPGDHIEIQWRSSQEIPYEWWYAVIGHLRSCNGQENLCRCQYSDRLIVEFIQYSPVELSRKKTDHQYYGGLRKLGAKEIDIWKKLQQQSEATLRRNLIYYR